MRQLHIYKAITHIQDREAYTKRKNIQVGTHLWGGHTCMGQAHIYGAERHIQGGDVYMGDRHVHGAKGE